MPADSVDPSSQPTASTPAPDLGPATTADGRPLDDLPVEKQRAIAQDMARAEPDLTGKILAARFGRKERWGREQLAAAHPDDNGNHRAARPPVRRHASAPPTAANGTDSSRHGTPQDPQPTTAGRHAGTPPATSNGKSASDSGGTPSAQRPAAGINGASVPHAAQHAGVPDMRRGTRQAPTGTGRSTEAAGNTPETAEAESQQPAVPRSLIVLAVVAVATVAVVTMLASYTHTHDLAAMAGAGWLAAILPAAVDGLVVAGSTSLMVDRRIRGRSYAGHPLAWAAVAIGLGSSMAANIVAVDPTLVDPRVVRWVMAGYAPVALAISGHLLLRMFGEATDPSVQRPPR